MPYVKCDNCKGVSHMNFADPKENLTATTTPVCGRCYNTPEGKQIIANLKDVRDDVLGLTQ